MEYEKEGFFSTNTVDSDFSLQDHTPKNRISSVNIGGSIFSTPSILKDLIVFGCNDSFIYALDKNGEKRWSFKTNGIVFSSPTVFDDSITIGSNDGFVYNLDSNGELKWKSNVGSKVYGTAVIVNDMVYIGTENGVFRALTLEDGKEIWKLNTGDELWLSPAVSNDSIIIGNHSGLLYRVSKDGEVLWKYQAGDCAISTPCILDKNNNVVSNFWNRSFKSFPKTDNCKIVLGAGDGYLRCLNLEDSKLIWKTFINRIGASASFVNNNNIFIGSYDGNIYSIDVSGKIRWRFQTGNKIVSSPFVSNDTVFIGASDCNLYAINSKTGELNWRFLTDGEVISSPLVSDGVIYFGSWDGHFYALSLKDKSALWKFNTSISYPSFIVRPHTVDLKTPIQRPNEFRATSTLRGYKIEGSINEMGERTSTFYGSRGTSYKTKDVYRAKRDKY